MGLLGQRLSWCSGLVRSRLDCMLVTKPRLSKWPLAALEHFWGDTSDHVTLITCIGGIEGSRWPFYVFNSWFDKEQVKSLVKDNWCTMLTANPLFRTIHKLKNVKLHLKRWALEQDDPCWMTQGLVDTLDITTKNLEEDPTSEMKKTKVIETQTRLRQHYKDMERDTKQLCHANQLQLGDENTSTFARMTRERRSRNSVLKLTNERGETYLVIDEAKRRKVDYFIQLYTQQRLSQDYVPWFLQLVSPARNVWLERTPRQEEIK